MSYQQTVSEIRAAAIAVNPSGRFEHGRHVDLSQMFEGDYPIINLYPLNINPSIDPDFFDSSVVLLGFFIQDKPDTSNLEREALISEMDTLSNAFIVQITSNKLVKVTNLSKEPQYQQYGGTISGFAIRFTYQNFTPC